MQGRFDHYTRRTKKIDTSASGNLELLPGIPGTSIVVLSVHLVAESDTEAKFLSQAAEITGPIINGGKGIAMGYDPDGLFWTNPGDPLVLNNEQAVQVSGFLKYVRTKVGEGAGIID